MNNKKIIDGNREAHKVKYRSDRSIMPRAIDLDSIRIDLFSLYTILACLPAGENDPREFLF